MNPDDDKKNFDAKVAEAKTGIERHLNIAPDEKSARALVEGVLQKVLKRRDAS